MLYEVYEELQKAPRLSGASQTFGSVSLDPISSPPHIAWIPTTDDYTDPHLAALPAVVHGKRVEIESILLRRAGCDLHVFEKDYLNLETLLNELHNALYDTLRSFGNYSIGQGRWVDRSSLSENTVGYIQPIAVFVPIYRALPAELAGSTSISLP